jgi:hypothetical protein
LWNVFAPPPTHYLQWLFLSTIMDVICDLMFKFKDNVLYSIMIYLYT